ncbi:MAG: hypothetical protein ACFE9T_04650 [Promethearchaeota archaeon]
MTNLLEKSLIIGFGIFTLLIFFSLVSPFLDDITDFNNNEKKDIEIYTYFINEIDQAILYVIDNPEEYYLKYVEYPTNLNITFYNQYAKFDFIISNEKYNIIFFYEAIFAYNFFHDILPKIYLLNVSFNSHQLKIQFID